jgi:hypothetical protein
MEKSTANRAPRQKKSPTPPDEINPFSDTAKAASPVHAQGQEYAKSINKNKPNSLTKTRRTH